MKNLFFLILSAAFFVGCQNNSKTEEKTLTENSLFETDFSDYKELDALAEYEKEIDTSVHMEGWQDKFRLMNLRKKENYLVLFYKVTELDSREVQSIAYRAIDTLKIKNLKEDERVTVGYCFHEDYYEGEIIAVIKENDSLYANDIVKAWRANPESETIEVLEDHEGINCLNEYFESENSSIPIEKIS